jgi:hypothetical protein
VVEQVLGGVATALADSLATGSISEFKTNLGRVVASRLTAFSAKQDEKNSITPPSTDAINKERAEHVARLKKLEAAERVIKDAWLKKTEALNDNRELVSKNIFEYS